jgi:predicted dehydrogenase
VRSIVTTFEWGLVGGGEGSQIGFAHLAASALDRRFRFVAGALDIDADKGRAYGVSLGLDPARSYGDWHEMLAAERDRPDRPKLVTVATPNATHFEITRSFLESGFHVLCEKPMTMTLDDAQELVGIAERSGRTLAVNYGYSGYPMVRHMRAMVGRGDLGAIRVVTAEFAGGFLADAADADNPRVRWRFDPRQAGFSAVTMDCGIHALHLTCFVTGQHVTEVSSDFASLVPGRELEDDSLTAFRMDGGIVGRLWASGLAIGRTHGLTLQVFGETGGLRWSQEQPNQLQWTPLNEPSRVLERGAAGLSPAADRASRITVGHPEGMVFAFGNIYRDFAEVIDADLAGREPDPLALTLPTAEDGHHTLAVVAACAASARQRGAWVPV